MFWLALAFVAVPSLVDVGPDGCGRARWGWSETPAGLCVRQVVPVQLESEPMVAAVVELPRDRSRRGVFIYRRGLVPRFLGSGFGGWNVSEVFADGDVLVVSGTGHRLRCHFEGFALGCDE